MTLYYSHSTCHVHASGTCDSRMPLRRNGHEGRRKRVVDGMIRLACTHVGRCKGSIRVRRTDVLLFHQLLPWSKHNATRGSDRRFR